MKVRVTAVLFGAAFCVLAACATLCNVACATTLDPAPDPTLEPGRALYSQKCQGCHRLRQPSKIDHKKWPSILEKMSVKAKLTPDQQAQIDAYVKSIAPK